MRNLELLFFFFFLIRKHYQAWNFLADVIVFLLHFIQETVLATQMEILEGEKGWGERREGEEKTYPRIAQCSKCLPNSDLDLNLSLPLSTEIP